jgi:sulfur carrier protein
MELLVNGNRREVDATTLAILLEELGFSAAAVATAVNETFIPCSARAAQMLSAGDRVEVLAPMKGG